MNNIGIPKWINEQLLKGEKVISRITVGRRMNLIDYCATDKRLLRFRSKTDLDVLEYNKMSITFEKYGVSWHILRGILGVCGILLIVVAILGVGDPTGPYGLSTGKIPPPIALLFILFGVVFIVIAIISRYGYYQIRSPDINDRELKKWRIDLTRWGSGKVHRFAKNVEKMRRSRS